MARRWQDARAKKSEQSWILKLENALNEGPEPIHPGNSQYMQHIMKLDLHGPARRPPKEAIEKLEAKDRELGLGKRLRACREPDYLQESTRTASLPTLRLHYATPPTLTPTPGANPCSGCLGCDGVA